MPPKASIASLERPGAYAAEANHDRLVMGTLVAVEDDAAQLIDAAERLLPTLRDDSYYWQVLLALWVKNGRMEHVERWRALFAVPRRNHFRGMKKADRRSWRALPDPVIAYRAIAPDEDPDQALSWSLDTAVLRRLYPDRTIVTRAIPKDRVLFYVDRRGEREIITLF